MNLNLSRKWRSKNFDQLVGQELAVSMLKNSLYRNYFFPLYLFSGQRGCGKTTAARLFAAALNCDLLPNFQKNPKEIVLPCNTCYSCTALLAGNHPDFIEIDAASNTGVDNVRQLIEGATLLPSLGRKRIYLIDEAHMLSKAAFNAFLKILEEPPVNTLFIFATTDLHKIIDTVQSRSFQLFFKPLVSDQLVAHLAHVCAQEQIAYEFDALDKIAVYAQGSARDALNILEQVRFAQEAVTLSGVQSLLGLLRDVDMVHMLERALHKDVIGLQQALCTLNLHQYDPQRTWQLLCEIVRNALINTYAHTNIPVLIRGDVPTADLLYAFSTICQAEQLVLRSRVPVCIIEMVLHAIAMHDATPAEHKKIVREQSPPCQRLNDIQPHAAPVRSAQSYSAVKAEPIKKEVAVDGVQIQWQQFVEQTAQLPDPFIHSIFSHAHFKKIIPDTHTVEIGFKEGNSFFKDMAIQLQPLWRPLLAQIFQGPYTIAYELIAPEPSKAALASISNAVPINSIVQQQPKSAPVIMQKKSSFAASSTRAVEQSSFKTNTIRTRAIDVSDSAKWPKAHLLATFFPGTFVEVQGNFYE